MTDQQTTEEKPACGTIKPEAEPDENQAVTPQATGAPGAQNAQGLQAMSERDVNDYMETLIQAQQPPPHMEALEIGALTSYRGISQQSGNTERQLTRAQGQVEQLKAQLARLQGQTEAYVNLLVLAEDTRRAEAAKAAKSEAN